jgi:hypothetical protein
MKPIQNLTIAVSFIWVLTSCHTIRSITSRDNGATTKKIKKNESASQRGFIDGIEVTPGSVVTSNLPANRIPV